MANSPHIITRFAPSPTGLLHVGNIRTALYNWLFTRQHGGDFLLRFDDTDARRSEEKYITAITQDLQWLGLESSGSFRQSQRMSLYQKAMESLRGKNLIYPCYETPAELERARKRQQRAGKPPVYDRKARTLSKEDCAQAEKEGRVAYWRFYMDHEIITWHDMIRGTVSIDTATISDPVLVRADKQFLYMLPSVVDDMESKITHVMRGEDHIVNTAVQIALIKKLGGTPPTYAHHALLTDAHGHNLSKRAAALSIQTLREKDGIEPMAINSLVACLGTSHNIEAQNSLNKLIEGFSFKKLSRAPARFSEDELYKVNKKIVQSMSYAQAKPRLQHYDIDASEDFWMAVRSNITTMSQTALWWKVIYHAITPVIKNQQDKDFLIVAAKHLPEEPWNETTWKTWTKELATLTNRHGRELFMPLRLALTGQSHGPEMANILPLIRGHRTQQRLAGNRA